MDPTEGGALRAARAVLVAATALATAAAGHLAAGGAVPGPVVVGALLAVTTVAVLPVSGARTFRARVLVPVGVALQVVLHHALTLLPARPSAGTPGHHGPTPVHAGTATALPPADAALPLHADPRMLLAHVVAAVATAVVLAATDRAARTTAAWLSWVLPLLAHAAVPAWTAPRSVPVDAAPVAAAPGAALGPAARRRGPPAPVRVGP